VREQARVAHELAEQQAQRERLPLEQQDAAAALERALVATRLERIENTVRERVAVVAPVSGTLTAVLAEQGQSVAADEALVSIVPAGARLEAHLYAPSSAIGLIRVGDSVELRYAAFPYRRFGTFRGTVRAISGSALPLETVAPLGVDILGSAGALYRVTVALPSQSVMYRNERYALRAGMRIEGEVMRETYRFYEWALAPLRTRPAPHTASR